MSYQDNFEVFLNQVELSVKEGNFAKLTMAKTIGKPDLKNIFVRPIYAKSEFKVLLKYHFRSKDSKDSEEELTLEQAFSVLKLNLKKSFLSVLLFTTTKDITFKINKNNVGTITESSPTFSHIVNPNMD